MDSEPAAERIPGFCALCRSRCGCINVVTGGVLTAVEPNPDHPTGAALCAKGRAAPDLVASGERLLHPLKRTRPKDDPDPGWQRIGWDEALDTTADALRRFADAGGPESVAFAITTPSGTAMSDAVHWVERLKNAYGSPNDIYGTEICNWHKDHAHRFTYGEGLAVPDYARTGCIVLWGHNPSTAWLASAQRAAAAKKRGAKVVVIDPRRAGLAAKADLWLRVRPGSDGALALGVAHVMIERGWYDAAFVRRWTNGPLLVRDDDGRFLTAGDGAHLAWDEATGTAVPVAPGAGPDGLALFGTFDVDGIACRPAFDHYAALCRAYPASRVAAECWVPADQVEAMARLLHDSGPVSYYAWSGVGQHTNATQTDRAIALLHALAGDHDAAGGNTHFAAPATNDVAGWELLPADQKAKTLGVGDRPLGPPGGGWVTTDDLYGAILTGRPYPVRGLVGFGANLLVSHADAQRGAAALRALDFFVHADLFMTPTAALADIVLPVNTPWEREALRIGFEIDADAAAFVQLRPAAVASRGESRSDAWIAFALAERLGLGNRFWNGDIDSGYRHMLEPTGVSLDTLRAHPEGVRVAVEAEERRYEHRGFATPTGRIEVYSERFRDHGYDPVPDYVAPLGGGGGSDPAFPLVLTSAKAPQFCHSQHRHLARLRRHQPDPVAEIHPDTAAARGVADGDWIALETPSGRIRVRARLRDTMHPDVVSASYGWWQGCAELGLPGYDALGADGANFNLLISDAAADPISGSVPHRSYICEIRALDDDGSTSSG